MKLNYKNSIQVGYRVLVQLYKNEEDEVTEVKSAGGIITEVRDNKRKTAVQRSTQIARVVHIPEGAFSNFSIDKPWYKVGDLVLICKYSGDDLEDIDEDGKSQVYRAIYAQDVQAILEEVK